MTHPTWQDYSTWCLSNDRDPQNNNPADPRCGGGFILNAPDNDSTIQTLYKAYKNGGSLSESVMLFFQEWDLVEEYLREDTAFVNAISKWNRHFNQQYFTHQANRESLTADYLNSIPNFFETIIELLVDNKKINAIKFVREHTNLGLHDAKDFIDEFQEKNGI